MKLSVRDLHKRYGTLEAVRGVSFDVGEGEILGLLGPNGAGKTTTLECIVGLREPDAGEIFICGLDARRQRDAVKQRFGASLQGTALQDKITPREALALFGSFYERHARPEELLERFALVEKADAPFDSLSGGQRQRLGLALAFVNRPEILFLDEPTAGLDAQARRELHQEIGRMKAGGHTVLLTTHQIDEAEQLCDRVAIIDHGRIVATGTPLSLMAASRSHQTISFVSREPVDRQALERLPGVQDVAYEGARARIRALEPQTTIAELMALLRKHNTELVELHVRKASLEDVFIELTGASLRD